MNIFRKNNDAEWREVYNNLLDEYRSISLLEEEKAIEDTRVVGKNKRIGFYGLMITLTVFFAGSVLSWAMFYMGKAMENSSGNLDGYDIARNLFHSGNFILISAGCLVITVLLYMFNNFSLEYNNLRLHAIRNAMKEREQAKNKKYVIGAPDRIKYKKEWQDNLMNLKVLKNKQNRR